MAEMTEEEANALDELWTRTTPKVDPSKPGFFARQGFKMVSLDKLSAAYITARAEATRKTPEEIIGDLVREKLVVNADGV
jgi:N-acetylglutamate synthase-like GNAT family acetyltransferase